MVSHVDNYNNIFQPKLYYIYTLAYIIGCGFACEN